MAQRLVLVAVTMLLWGTLSSSCRRPCQVAENCRRSCDCLNTETNTRNDCSLAFVCEGDEGLCEEAYDSMTCDEMCASYQKEGICGVSRCRQDADCERNLECDVLNASGQPSGLKRACTVFFPCMVEQSACDVGTLATDAALCAGPCSNTPVVDGAASTQ
jgi:hypothetical protein